MQLKHNALDIKLEQLNLVYSYELKRAQEIEKQKEIKAQMIEEEKVRREIEKQKAKIEKDEKQISGEIDRLMKYVQNLYVSISICSSSSCFALSLTL